MYQHPTNRSPVARNMWKVNKPSVVAPKKGKGSRYKRVKKVFIID